jgi:histidyl-tRNA synthetase
VVGGQPRELTECDFDIVGPMQHKYVYCSEVLKVLCEVLTDLSDLGPFLIRINNYKILDGVLQAFDVEPKVQDQLRLLIGSVAKNTWVTTRKEILHKNLIPPKMVEFLGAVFSSTEPFNTLLDKIEQALGSRSRLVIEGIHEMRALWHFAGTFGVADKLKFDMSLVYNYQQFSDIVYQAYLTKHDIGVVAAGGCYDFLLSHFSTVPTAPNAKVGASRFTTSLQEGYRGMKQGLDTTAVGVNFALDKIVAFIHRQKVDNQSSVEDLSTKTETDVFIYSVNKNMLEDRIQLANQLWSMNIKAEYMYREDITLEELGTLCKNMGVFCIIVLRDTTYRNGIIKIKTMENLKGETTVKIRDLPELVAQSKQKAQKSKRPLHKQNSNQDIPPPEFSLNQARNQHIDVDILGNKTERSSKVKKKIENKAQNIISPVLKSLITYSNIYKVAAVDIPVKIIKEVVAQNRPHSDAINAVAEKYTNFKRSLLDLQEFLAKNRNLPFVFVYSIKDDGYVFIACALDQLKEK